MRLKLKKYLRCDTHDEITWLSQDGYVIPSLLGFLLFTSLISISALNISATQIRMIQSELNYLKAFISTERVLMEAERNLTQGLDVQDTVDIELYKPKHFRNKSGITSQHYKLTSSTKTPFTHIQLQSTIRIDTPITSSKIKSKQIERLNWKKLSKE
ncbi:MAG: hypothetical protein ACO222_04545 [Polynucleobacter sp.]